jgi:hypothetical protein
MLNFSNHTAGAPADTEGSLSPSPARCLEDGHGNSYGAVIDLAGGHDHGRCIVVLHFPSDAGDTGPHWPEKLPVPPPGFHYRLHCEDCPSTVTLAANPPSCVEAGYVVTHSPSCPWLATRLAGAR